MNLSRQKQQTEKTFKRIERATERLKNKTALDIPLKIYKRQKSRVDSTIRRKELSANKILEYLSNPENKIPEKRQEYIKFAGYSGSWASFRKLFSEEDLNALEHEALERRRKAYAKSLMSVDAGLLKRAEKGFASEVKLTYERFEGWRSGTNIELTGKGGAPLIMFPQIQINTIADWEKFISKEPENPPIDITPNPQIEAPIE